MSVFDPAGIDQIRELAQQAVAPADGSIVSYDTAIDYLAGRQIRDVLNLLQQRYPSSMSGEPGQEMAPHTLPLTERYVAEAANAYDHGVKRKLVDPDGQESESTEAITAELNKHLDMVQIDESLSRVDQVQHLIESCGVWFGHKRGRLHLRHVLPQHSALVKGDEQTFDDSDQEDYRAYVVRLATSENIAKNSYGWASRTETAFFEGPTPQRVDRVTAGPYPNPWTWPQAKQEDPTRPAVVAERPLMPIVWWHRVAPIGSILPQVDSQIVVANRELNLLWSVLLDTFRFQGFDTPVFNLSNPDAPKAKRRHGARFPVALGVEETFNYAHSSVAYSELVKVLTDYQRMIALCLRMSPNDFSIDGQVAASGFAKMIDSLPKIEARASRIRRLQRMESEMMWPRVCAILVWLGVLPPAAKQLRLVTEFPDVEFPKSPDEIAKELETDVKYDLDTPAHVYARRHGVSVEEAIESVKKNAEVNRELKQAEAAAQPPPFGQQQQPQQPERLGSLIRRRRGGNAVEE